jgi:DNA polymerase-1
MTTREMRMSVHPGSSGTFPLPQLDALYTVGRDHVAAAAEKVVNSHEPLSVDIETDGLGVLAMRIKAVAIGNSGHAVVLDPRDPYQRGILVQALADARVIVLHNAPFDVPLLVRNGYMRHADINKVVDTLIYCRLAEPDERTSKGLLAASARYLGGTGKDILQTAFKAAGVKKQSDGWLDFDIDRPVYVQGVAIDVISTARLLPLCRAAALTQTTGAHTDNGGPFGWAVTGNEAELLIEREQVLNRMFLRRAATGIRVDLDYLDRYRDTVGEENTGYRDLLAEANVAAGNNNSLITFLEANDLVPDDYPRTPKTGKPSGRADHLETLHHPVAQAFSQLKKNEKIDKDYLAKVVDLSDRDNRIHPTTSLLAAVTGRMSVSDPPLQQFPGDKVDDDGTVLTMGARGTLMADQGDSMTSIDWSQIEPVVAANIARDRGVLEGYEAGTSDLYTTIAQKAGVDRKKAKVILLAQMYGEGMRALAGKLGITEDEGWELRRAVFRPMPKVERLLKRLREIGEQHRMIFTVSGRIVPVPMGEYQGRVSVQTHKAVNFFVQGSAYDVLAEAMVRVEEAGLGDALYLAVHDELVVSKAAARDIEKIMTEPPERLIKMAGRTPILRCDSLDLGERWASA